MNKHDKEVQEWVEKMKQMDGRFILLHKPEKDFVGWYQGVQKDYGLTPYMTIEKPDPYLMQNRYQGDNKEEMFFFSYAHRYNSASDPYFLLQRGCKRTSGLGVGSGNG